MIIRSTLHVRSLAGNQNAKISQEIVELFSPNIPQSEIRGASPCKRSNISVKQCNNWEDVSVGMMKIR